MIATSAAVMVPESLVTIVMAVAVYFLILGLLNSRKAPQLLTGPEDSLLLIGSVCLLGVPALVSRLGVAGMLMAACLAAAVAIARIILSRPRTWVIYNLRAAAADALVGDTLSSMGRSFIRDSRQFLLPDGSRIEVSCFALLRSVSIRLRGGDDQLRRQFGIQLAKTTATRSVETSQGAMALLLVAMAMLIAPLTLAVQRAGEIVRLISDFLQ